MRYVLNSVLSMPLNEPNPSNGQLLFMSRTWCAAVWSNSILQVVCMLRVFQASLLCPRLWQAGCDYKSAKSMSLQHCLSRSLRSHLRSPCCSVRLPSLSLCFSQLKCYFTSVFINDCIDLLHSLLFLGTLIICSSANMPRTLDWAPLVHFFLLFYCFRFIYLFIYCYCFFIVLLFFIFLF